MEAEREIELLIRAKYPLLYVTSWEERRVEESIRSVSGALKRQLHTWSVTQGLKPPLTRASGPTSATPLSGELEVLAQIHEAPEFTVFLLKDFHSYLRDHRVVRLLRDLSARLRGRKQTLILLSPSLNLPIELEKDVTVVEYPLPSQEDISAILDQAVDAVKDNTNLKSDIPADYRELIVKSAQGLTADEIESALARSLVETRTFCIEQILEEKKQIVKKTGMLEFYPATARLDDIGGHDILKDWLVKRTKSFTDAARDFGIPAPKGVLLIGVQGCGKSLVAKAVSAAYSLPMLKMDIGRIFGSLVGQSEENMRKAIRIAESLAPCVLWIDELEKGLSGMGSSGVSDSGTTARVFSTFLTWMQDKTKPVFLVATANDVTSLPPELLRKGRFDEIFFIDLPSEPERKVIFEIHLKKRKRDPAKFSVPKLSKLSEGFSGAEIEQVVISALNHAFFDGRELKTSDLVEEAKSQVPLSRMMAEDIDALRDWAKLRARPSSKNPL